MDLLGRNKNDINEHVRLHPEFLTECEESRVQRELRDHKEYNNVINAKSKES